MKCKRRKKKKKSRKTRERIEKRDCTRFIVVTISKRIVLIETKRIRKVAIVAMLNCWATVQIPLRKIIIMLS